MGYLVRPMSLGDVLQAEEIDKEAFPTLWPSPSFKDELLHNRLAYYLVVSEAQDRHSSPEPPPPLSPPGRWGWLGPLRRLVVGEEPPAPTKELILGMAGLWFMFDEAHLTTIAVRASHRGLGLGELLLLSSLEVALERGATVMTLEVRASNRLAQALYEKYGFAKVGVRPGYYADNNEDAYLMSTDKLISAAYREKLLQLREAYRSRWGEERRFFSAMA